MDARRSGWSEAPIVEMLIPSVLDDNARAAGASCRFALLPACRAEAP